MSEKSLVLSIPEVAKALSISRGLAYSLARRDQLGVRVLKLGERRMVVSRRSLEDLLSSRQSKEE